MESMASIAAWLAQTSLSHTLAESSWAVPALQSIHIMSVAVVLSSVMMLNVRLAGFIGRKQPLRSNSMRFYPWIWGALLVLVATGLFQIMAEPERELLNWIFWTKMGLIVAASLITAPVRSRIDDVRYAEMAPAKRNILRALAMASLVLWILVITCGRWIAYAGGPAS